MFPWYTGYPRRRFALSAQHWCVPAFPGPWHRGTRAVPGAGQGGGTTPWTGRGNGCWPCAALGTSGRHCWSAPPRQRGRSGVLLTRPDSVTTVATTSSQERRRGRCRSMAGAAAGAVRTVLRRGLRRNSAGGCGVVSGVFPAEESASRIDIAPVHDVVVMVVRVYGRGRISPGSRRTTGPIAAFLRSGSGVSTAIRSGCGCRCFSVSSSEKFRGPTVSPGSTASPVVPGSRLRCDCLRGLHRPASGCCGGQECRRQRRPGMARARRPEGPGTPWRAN